MLNNTYNYDVAIIGSGVGGLTAACLLSKCGLKVAVVEKEPHAGGYLAGFQRKGYRFDTAIHWLNQCDEKGFVTKIFKLIGSDHPVCKSYKTIQRYKGDSTDFLLTNNPEEMMQALISKFPEDRKGIIQFFKASKKIGHSLSNFKKLFLADEALSLTGGIIKKLTLLKFALPFIPFVGYDGHKMKKGLKKYFRNEKIHQIFSAETDLLSCMVPIGWAYHSDYQYPPEGGGQVIPEWMVHYLKNQGCELFFNAPVDKILVEDGAATGVLIHYKSVSKEIRAKYVIAACDLEKVYKELLPAGIVPQKVLQNLEGAETYASSFTVSIALDCPAEQLGFGSEMIHLFKEDIPKEAHNSGNPEVAALTILAPSVTDKSLAPEGCGTLMLFMSAYMSQHDHWHTGPGMQRGAAYKALKNALAEKLISRVQQSISPGLSEHIVFYEVATPVTHWRYTGNKMGTMMGTKPSKKNMQNKVAGYKTKVKNLFIGGQWAELGGGVPIAAKAGTNAALLVLKETNRQAYDEILSYFEDKKSIEELNRKNIFSPYTNCWKRNKTAAEKYFYKAAT